MPRTIHFQVEGETEKFLQEMAKVGLTERDVFAKALGLLNLVYRTGRVAFLRSDAEQRKYADEIIDFVFTLEELEPAKQKGMAKSSRRKSAGPIETVPGPMKTVQYKEEDEEEEDDDDDSVISLSAR